MTPFSGLVAECKLPALTALLVQGSATNQDGRSSSLTAPNGPAQQALIASAIRRSRATQVSLLAAHGTGTPLGDPIETGAIGAALGRLPAAGPLLLASAKSCYGHTEGAAGALSPPAVACKLRDQPLISAITFGT